MSAVPVAVVGEENGIFNSFLEGLDGTTLTLSRMEEEDAREALKE